MLDGSYDFQKRVIEQSESRSAIESIVSRLTGVTAAVSLKIVASEAPKQNEKQASAVAKPTPKAVEKRNDAPPQVKGPSSLRIRDDVDPEQDAFVQQVVDLFGAKVVRITDAPARRVATSSEGQLEAEKN